MQETHLEAEIHTIGLSIVIFGLYFYVIDSIGLLSERLEKMRKEIENLKEGEERKN